MTPAEKLIARIQQIIRASQSHRVYTVRFAIVDGQPVWWSVSDPARLEGYSEADNSTAIMVEFLGGESESVRDSA